MSHLTIVNRSQLFAAATAISAVGLLVIPVPAQAKPMLPLAPACSQYGFTGGFSIRDSAGWQTFMSSTGPATVGGRSATVFSDNVTKYTGNVSGGIQGRKIDITFRQDNSAREIRFTGTVGADGTVHNWSFQTYALITLRRAGTSLQLFKDNIGKEVWVRGCTAKNGKEHYAAAGTLKFASDGIVRQMGQLQD